MTSIHVRPLRAVEADQCEAILRSLPDWFGLEDSIVQYRRDIEFHQTFVAELDDDIAGFLTLVEHNSHTSEIQVMAVLQEFHRHGIGRALVEFAETRLAETQTEFLEVKTLGPSRPDKFYSRTHAFYVSLGFCPIQEVNLWGPDNPCLIMIKRLK
jgi:GNAT superfamily N-acetyltransferase